MYAAAHAPSITRRAGILDTRAPRRYDSVMRALHFTPPERLVDQQLRPYFLWDVDVRLDAFRALLASPDRAVAAYWLGKLMREARPDDVFQFVTLRQVRDLWSDVQPYLGRSRAFWAWLLERWSGNDRWLKRAPGFARASVSDGVETIDVDLVAEPVASIEPPQEAEREGVHVSINTRHEILVNKLNALMSRAEERRCILPTDTGVGPQRDAP
jgi:hypothetical protein